MADPQSRERSEAATVARESIIQLLALAALAQAAYRFGSDDFARLTTAPPIEVLLTASPLGVSGTNRAIGQRVGAEMRDEVGARAVGTLEGWDVDFTLDRNLDLVAGPTADGAATVWSYVQDDALEHAARASGALLRENLLPSEQAALATPSREGVSYHWLMRAALDHILRDPSTAFVGVLDNNRALSQVLVSGLTVLETSRFLDLGTGLDFD